MSSNKTLLELRQKHIPQGPFNITPLFVKKAEGALIYDVDGNEYIDFAGGIGVVNTGHCSPEVVKAIQQQAAQYIHTCFHVVMYEPYLKLAQKLNEITPGNFPKKTMFVNSGAEGVENAVKVARSYTKRSAIIVFEHAFHGRTLLAMTLTSKVKPYKQNFGPYAPEVYRTPYAYCYRCPFGATCPACDIQCAEHLNEIFKTHVQAEQVAAVLIEPVLGEGGFVVPPVEFLKKIKATCEKNGILYLDDEVQAGFGRAGKMFAVEYAGIEPDIIITAKSLAAGMPLAGITGKAEIMDTPQVGGLGGTYGGNPIACQAALASIEIIEKKNLTERANQIGQRVFAKFKELQNKYEIIGDVRGIGAMIAMELVNDRTTKIPASDKTKLLIQKCYEKGLIMISAGTNGNVIRILMPLVISEEQLERGLSIIEETLGEV